MPRAVAFIAFALIAGAASSSRADFRFCPRWIYSYTDQGLGEDHLRHSAGASHGSIAAAYSYAVLKKNGTTVWQGALDSGGCMPLQPSNANASYTVMLAAFGIGREVSNGFSVLRVWNTRAHTVRWFQYTVELTATTATQRIEVSLGHGDAIAAVAAAAVHITGQDSVIMGGDTPIYLDEGCGTAGSCGDASSIDLGVDGNGAKDAFKKTVVAHEIGHAMADRMFGLFRGDYEAAVSSAALCRCDHVQPVGFRSHCLQSFEALPVAIDEGWAQFYALDALNRGDQADGVLPYYKQFLQVGQSVVNPSQPPVAIGGHSPLKWNTTYCSSNYQTAGTSLDWMTFLWEINNRVGWMWSYTNLRQLFQDACGGDCGNSETTFNVLVWSVAVRWGSTHPMAASFASSAQRHLVP